MWYWIIAGSIFLILEVLALLSFTPLKNKYEFFEFIHCWCADESLDDIGVYTVTSIVPIGSIVYTVTAILIAVLFPFVIVSIVGYFISRFILFVIEKCKGLK